MIKFPGLGLCFNINKTAFELFNVKIHYYACCIIMGVLIAIILCFISKEKFDIKFDFVFDTLIYALIMGVIGARIYYVIFNLDYYLKSPINIFKIRDGGLAIYGGLIFGFLVVIKRCKKNNIKILDFFDYTVPFIAIAQSIGRWGNFFNKEAYGTETNNIFRMGIDTQYGYQEVHPTFLYESISTFLIFVLLKKLQKNRKFEGEIFYLYLFLYSGIRMMIEALRIDSLMLKNIRISQVLSIAIFVVSGIILLKNFIKYIYKFLKE